MHDICHVFLPNDIVKRSDITKEKEESLTLKATANMKKKKKGDVSLVDLEIQ